jgi:hypothetical protein
MSGVWRQPLLCGQGRGKLTHCISHAWHADIDVAHSCLLDSCGRDLQWITVLGVTATGLYPRCHCHRFTLFSLSSISKHRVLFSHLRPSGLLIETWTLSLFLKHFLACKTSLFCFYFCILWIELLHRSWVQQRLFIPQKGSD